jgi:hypothetical protein
MSDDRHQLAASLLQEAVYQSRARQAAGVALEKPGGSPGGCGLGSETAIDLELTPHGEEVFRKLWPREIAPTELVRIEGLLRDWIEQQDAFDRKRNHYLRDFRNAHGFDRRTYTVEVAQEFDAGLARINAEVEERLRRSASELLAE